MLSPQIRWRTVYCLPPDNPLGKGQPGNNAQNNKHAEPMPSGTKAACPPPALSSSGPVSHARAPLWVQGLSWESGMGERCGRMWKRQLVPLRFPVGPSQCPRTEGTETLTPHPFKCQRESPVPNFSQMTKDQGLKLQCPIGHPGRKQIIKRQVLRQRQKGQRWGGRGRVE